MRIVSVGSVPPDWGGRRIGGVANYHADLVQALVDGGHEARVDVTGVFTGDSGDVHHPLIVNSGVKGAAEERLFAHLCRTSDAVILHHVTHRFATYHERSALDTPALIVLHSLTGLDAADFNRREAAERQLKRAALVVTPSSHMLGRARSLHLVGANSDVAYPPLGSDFMGVPIEHSRSRRVIFVGQLDRNKGIVPLVEALEQLPAWSAEIFGDGPLRPQVLHLIEKIGLSARVRLAGTARRKDIAEALGRASVLCVPSLSESFGIVYIEALARGAYIAGYPPSVQEIGDVLGMTCGVGCSQSPIEIKKALEGLHQSGLDRAGLALATQDRFSARRCGSTFARLLARGPVRAVAPP